MSTLSPRQLFLLDEACKPIFEGFGEQPYLVGTAAQNRGDRPPRDIDVRLILFNEQFDMLKAAIGENGIRFLGIAIGQYLESRTNGMPIDFQIQRMTEANEQHRGTRNPLGLRSLVNYLGDTEYKRREACAASTPSKEANTP